MEIFDNNHFFEYGISHIDSYGFINAFCIIRENIGLQGGNLQQKKFQFRYLLLEQARNWARRCMSNGYEKKKRYWATARIQRAVYSMKSIYLL